VKKKDPERERELFRRIKAAGIPIAEFPEREEDAQLLIKQNVDAYDSSIFELNGGAGLVVPLKIVPNIPIFVLSGIHIELDRWKDALFCPLQETEDCTWPRYEFAGRSELKFNRDDVLNRFLTRHTVRRRGHPIVGLFLAFSPIPMPSDIRAGEILEGSFRIYDQFDHAHSAKIHTRVERQAVPVRQQLAEGV
jgi:hypothetical protein